MNAKKGKRKIEGTMESHYRGLVGGWSTAFFKEFEIVGKFFKRATKNWKTLCDHALQTHLRSRLRLLHADNYTFFTKTAKSLEKQRVLKNAI